MNNQHHSFIHFEPVGHSADHGFNQDNDEHYESMLGIKGGFNHNGGLPPYIVDGSLEAFQWRRENPEEEWEPRWAYEANEEEGTGSNGAHYAAHVGNVEVLEHIIENPQHRKEMIHEHDNNGWLPIHEVSAFFGTFYFVFIVTLLILNVFVIGRLLEEVTRMLSEY